MPKITLIQLFRDVAEVKEQYQTTLPKPHDWRLLPEQVVGSINGVPTAQGTAIATNGILVAIAQDGNKLFIGHLDSFIADEQQPAIEVTVAVAKKPRTMTPKVTTDISEFV